ncbi:MAG: MBL fold metallo-hydrolase [Stagnimonas sp.]|nr:MBL fold metallo-hydrolase [Stagnimonas sp.]
MTFDAAPPMDLGYGITCLDTLQERPRMACCYLVERGADVAIVEAGTSQGVPRLLAELARRGIARERVRYLIVTHVHLDHAGGAGALLRELPAATLLVHPRGLRHLTDPSKLIAGATAVYGAAAMAEKYGEILAAPAERSRAVADDESLPFGDGVLQFIDSPGHARHHFSIWDPRSQGFFTGDTFGLSYREFDDAQGPWLIPTTTPVQFEPEAWEATLDRYLSFAPQRMYLTHYGAVGDVPRLAASLRAGIRRYAELARRLRSAPERHDALKAALRQDLLADLARRSHRMPAEQVEALLAIDLELNAQGLGVWLDSQAPA